VSEPNQRTEVCRICGGTTEQLYAFAAALTSKALPVPGTTSVAACTACRHAQTRVADNPADYYASQYNFQAASPDEDDLYEVVGDRRVYRSQHQATVIERLVDFSAPVRVLDFGCGKAATLRSLTERHRTIGPYVFDVSEAYRPFWDEFVPHENQACFATPPEWDERFDVALSFFALEHVEDPHTFLASLLALLRPGGTAVVVLPNMYTNVSDLLVADHVNHFSPMSLRVLFSASGFNVLAIDEDAQRGAFVVAARRPRSAGEMPSRGSDVAAATNGAPQEVAAYWTMTAERLRKHTRSLRDDAVVAIYGSGIYGLFIATIVRESHSVSCFLDSNPHRQRLAPLQIPVYAPGDLPSAAKTVFVGLNPSQSHAIMDAVSRAWPPDITLVYL